MLLSVIIPTHNRPERLRECLNALACQSQTGVDFEVLVVDDGSEPSMEPTVRSVQGLVIHYIRKPQGGPASARNLGASEAGGRYLVFLDDDCQPPRDWLGRIAEAVEANPGAILGGRTVNKLSGNKYSSASQLLVDFLYHYYQGADEGRFFTSNNLIVPKQDFEALGGFDEGFRRAAAEDREFGYRWIAEGRPLVFLPTILLYHSHQLSLPSFLRQHFNYGRGALRYWKLRSQREGKSIRVEPGRFYFRLVTYPFTIAELSLPQRLSMAFLMCVTQLANAMGFFWELVRLRLSVSGPDNDRQIR